eukprot:3195596-Ditylum_brightwellii.AAC.1
MQAGDYIYFALFFDTPILWYGGSHIYFIYGQNKCLYQLFMAAVDTNNHQTIDIMGSTGIIVPFTNNEKEV